MSLIIQVSQLDWDGDQGVQFGRLQENQVDCLPIFPASNHAVLISRTIQGTKEGRERLDRDHQFFDHSNPEGMRIREEVDIL